MCRILDTCTPWQLNLVQKGACEDEIRPQSQVLKYFMSSVCPDVYTASLQYGRQCKWQRSRKRCLNCDKSTENILDYDAQGTCRLLNNGHNIRQYHITMSDPRADVGSEGAAWVSKTRTWPGCWGSTSSQTRCICRARSQARSMSSSLADSSGPLP